jgi:hypothetical protein
MAGPKTGAVGWPARRPGHGDPMVARQTDGRRTSTSVAAIPTAPAISAARNPNLEPMNPAMNPETTIATPVIAWAARQLTLGNEFRKKDLLGDVEYPVADPHSGIDRHQWPESQYMQDGR